MVTTFFEVKAAMTLQSAVREMILSMVEAAMTLSWDKTATISLLESVALTVSMVELDSTSIRFRESVLV